MTRETPETARASVPDARAERVRARLSRVFASASGDARGRRVVAAADAMASLALRHAVAHAASASVDAAVVLLRYR